MKDGDPWVGHPTKGAKLYKKKGAHLKRKDANFEEKDAILKNLCAEMGKKFVTKGAILDKKGARLDNKKVEIRETKFANKLGAILVKNVRKLFSLKLKLNTKITLDHPPPTTGHPPPTTNF